MGYLEICSKKEKAANKLVIKPPRRLIQPALVICCKDYRYIQATQRFVQRQGVRWYDLKATAGGLRALLDAPEVVRRWILKDVLLVHRLHGVKHIIIVQHQDCAGYGGSSAFKDAAAERAFHQKQFRRAKKMLTRALSGVRVAGYFISGAPNRIRLTPM